jgi:hypothetical protein
MDTAKVVSLMSQVKVSQDSRNEEANESLENKVIEALNKAGVDDEHLRYAIGEQWIAKIVSSVVEQIVNRPQLFQAIVDGIIDRIKARL